VDNVRGYYEPKSADLFSDKERSLALHQALLSSFPEQLLVEAQTYFFADSLKRPVFIYCAGVRSVNVTVKSEKKKIKLDLAVLGHVGHLDLTRLPIYEERKLSHEIEKQRWESAVKNSTAYVNYRSEIPLTPGRFNWKIVFQNQVSGKLGTFQQILDVPDFSRSSIPSSLLLTRDIQSLEAELPQGGEAGTGILVQGDTQFLPQPANRFKPGDKVYLLYDLYNPTDTDFEAVDEGIQMGLLKNGKPVQVAVAHGDSFPDGENKVIRFTAYFSTEGLSPGNYQVLAILPNYQTRSTPHLESSFELVESELENLVR